jgi:hypothetical protein
VKIVMATTPTARSIADTVTVAMTREITTGALRTCLPAMSRLGSDVDVTGLPAPAAPWPLHARPA